MLGGITLFCLAAVGINKLINLILKGGSFHNINKMLVPHTHFGWVCHVVAVYKR